MCGRELLVATGALLCALLVPSEAAEPQLVRDINEAPAGSRPRCFTVLGDRVFFSADEPEHGDELWVSDGTADGTSLVCDLAPGAGGSAPAFLTVAGDHLFFAALRMEYGQELWAVPVEAAPAGEFVRGNVNADDNTNIADAICLLGYLFGPAGDPCKTKVPACRDAAKEAVAVELHREGKLSLGQAAEMLGLSIYEADGVPSRGVDSSPQ